MFEHTKAFSGFSADDIPAAKKFYGETLGIPVSEEHGILTLHLAGDRGTKPPPEGGPAGQRSRTPRRSAACPVRRPPKPAAVSPSPARVA